MIKLAQSSLVKSSPLDIAFGLDKLFYLLGKTMQTLCLHFSGTALRGLWGSLVSVHSVGRLLIGVEASLKHRVKRRRIHVQPTIRVFVAWRWQRHISRTRERGVKRGREGGSTCVAASKEIGSAQQIEPSPDKQPTLPYAH